MVLLEEHLQCPTWVLLRRLLLRWDVLPQLLVLLHGLGEVTAHAGLAARAEEPR